MSAVETRLEPSTPRGERGGVVREMTYLEAISDALRWEMSHGRVYRVRHGRYRPAEMPRATEHRIRNRVMELRAAAADRAA